MKKLIYTIAFTLAGLVGMAQTNQPLPPDAQPLTALTYLSPSDSTVWFYNERSSLAINVGVWADVVELFNQKWSNAQIDSAIAAQIGGINFPVTSVNSMTGDVTLAPTDLGLGNVDNTSDANKPVSTATQEALDLKEDKSNKVTSLSTPNNTTYPTTQAVKTAIDAIEPPSVTGANGIQVNSGEVSPVYGTSAGTVAQGNDSRINNGQTAFNSLGNFWDIVSNPLYNQLSDLNDALPGRYELNSTALNRPFGFSSTVTVRQYSSSTNDLIQINWPFRNSGNFATRNKDNNGDWGAWRTYWHDGNFTPPVAFTRSTNGLVPAPGGSGSTRYLREDGSWVVPEGGGGGGTATDLSVQNRTSTTLQIGSSTGSAATIPIATTSLGGLMSAADKVKLNSAITDFVETDPTVPAYVKSITTGNISNWNTAYGWGNHASMRYLTGTTVGASNISPIAETIDFNNVTGGFVARVAAGSTNTPDGTSDKTWMLLNMYSVEAGNAQIAMGAGGSGYSNTGMMFRQRNNQAWRRVWDDANFNPSDYVTSSNFTWSNLSGKPSTFAPSPHTHNASDINAGTLAAARIGNSTVGNAKLSNMSANTIKGRSSSSGAPQDLTASQVRTIINVANGATANSSDATLLNRANHTGTQAINTIAGLQSELDGKLSTSGGDVTRTVLGWPNAVSGSESNFINSRIQSIISGNSGLHVFGDGDNNARRFGIQVSHYDPAFATATGILELNPFGGNVYVNGLQVATLGTGSTQVRNNSQLDARYLQSISGGSGINVSGGSTIAVDGTVVRTSGNQTIGGTKTFSSPVVVKAVSTDVYNLSAGTTISISNGGKQYTTLSSSRTLNVSGLSPGDEVQVEIANTSSSAVTISFTGGTLPEGVNGNIPAGKTAVFSMTKFNSSTRVTKVIF